MRKIVLATAATLSALMLAPISSVLAATPTSSYSPVESSSQTVPLSADLQELSAPSVYPVSQGTNLDFLTPYVKVENNQYVLNVPSNIELNKSLRTIASNRVTKANEFIKSNNLEPV